MDVVGQDLPNNVREDLTNGDARSLTDWLTDIDADPIPLSTLDELADALPQEAVDDIKTWSTKTAVSKATRLPMDEVTPKMLRDLTDGKPETLAAAIDAMGASPTPAELDKLKEFLPDAVVDELKHKTVKEALAAALGLQADEIDAGMVDGLQQGNSSLLLAWLEQMPSKPSPEQLEKLRDFVPEPALAELKDWALPPFKPEVETALEDFAGIKVPPPVLNQAKDNATALPAWLNKQGIVPSEKDTLDLVKRAELPEELKSELKDWQRSKLASEDVKQLKSSLGLPIPAAVVDAVNKGDENAVTDWLLDASKNDPKLLQKTKKLAKGPAFDKLPLAVQNDINALNDLTAFAELGGKMPSEIPKEVLADIRAGSLESLASILDPKKKPSTRDLDRAIVALSSPELADTLKTTLGPDCLGEWTEWTPCPVTCGRGNRTRYKPKTSKQCVVEATQTHFCHLPYCPQGKSNVHATCSAKAKSTANPDA